MNSVIVDNMSRRKLTSSMGEDNGEVLRKVVEGSGHHYNERENILRTTE